MTVKYTVSDVVVSDANPSEFFLQWANNENATAAMRSIACIIDNIENAPVSEYAPEYDTRTVRIVVEVTRHI